MANMTKRDLRTGMFGVDSDGEVFVVVGDKLQFETGEYNDLSDLNDKLEFDCCGVSVKALYEANCFNDVKDGTAKLIWKRLESPAEGEGKVKCDEITITEEQFFEAIIKANDRFFEVGKSVPGGIPGGAVMEAIMGLQNITFGELVGAILFNKEQK